MSEPIGIPDIVSLWRTGAELDHLRRRLIGALGGEPRWRINVKDWHYLRQITTSAGPAVAYGAASGVPDRLFGVPVDVVYPPDEQTFPQLVIIVDRRNDWSSIKVRHEPEPEGDE